MVLCFRLLPRIIIVNLAFPYAPPPARRYLHLLLLSCSFLLFFPLFFKKKMFTTFTPSTFAQISPLLHATLNPATQP
jgi:hypothetical protein